MSEQDDELIEELEKRLSEIDAEIEMQTLSRDAVKRDELRNAVESIHKSVEEILDKTQYHEKAIEDITGSADEFVMHGELEKLMKEVGGNQERDFRRLLESSQKEMSKHVGNAKKLEEKLAQQDAAIKRLMSVKSVGSDALEQVRSSLEDRFEEVAASLEEYLVGVEKRLPGLIENEVSGRLDDAGEKLREELIPELGEVISVPEQSEMVVEKEPLRLPEEISEPLPEESGAEMRATPPPPEPIKEEEMEVETPSVVLDREELKIREQELLEERDEIQLMLETFKEQFEAGLISKEDYDESLAEGEKVLSEIEDKLREFSSS